VLFFLFHSFFSFSFSLSLLGTVTQIVELFSEADAATVAHVRRVRTGSLVSVLFYFFVETFPIHAEHFARPTD
jgi:hypothetical protein